MGHFDYVLIKANEKLFAQEIEANAISSGFIEFDGKSFTSKRPHPLIAPMNHFISINYLYSCAMKNVPLMSQPFGFFRFPLNTFL